MGCCSKKKSAKSKKTVSLRADEGTVFEITVSVLQLVPKKGGANASNKSKKALPAAKGPAKKGAPGAKSASTSAKRTPNGKTPAVKGAPGAKGPPGGAKGAPALQRVPADKRPVKTPSTASSSKSGGPSSASGKKNGASSSAARSPNAADARQAKKRENHAKSLNKNVAKGRQDAPTSDVTTARSPPCDEPKKASKEKAAAKMPAPPPRPASRGGNAKKQQEKKAETSQSRGSSSSTAAARVSSSRAAKPSRVSRSKLPMQKLTISSHIEDGIVVSQWYYTELRELGTPPSSVADLLQGGPRQQLTLPQQQV
ncbi:hypothetical protein PRIPAC_72807 [Pristionchus pacificus]|uniref:Uncharacterized protein n=1 Tax=Pristionchus pacificus TaxID=54126 RepID=A0A2A6B4B6_PRIPA|nr:hypothetical protein PRIPAC_72807 [Pristionchus pacificus]|eukprot:PDM60726.1 hypothetical protein PRIPAC_54532 [Pristionchus pacificus]